MTASRVEPRWFRCNGDAVPFKIIHGSDEDTSSDPYPAFVIDPKKNDTCQMQFTIINTGSHTVHVRQVEFPAMATGEGSGFPLEVTENGGTFTPAKGDNEGYHSSVKIDVDEDLDGDSASIDVLVDLRPRSPVETGKINGFATLSALPRVHVSYLGVRGSVEGSINLTVLRRH